MKEICSSLNDYLRKQWPDCEEVSIEGLRDVPGGYSKRTYSFDARLTKKGGETSVMPLILRIDNDPRWAIMRNSRQREHEVLGRLRAFSQIPVPRSYFVEMDPVVFGQPAMIIERISGNNEATALFKNPDRAKEAESVARDLCEKLAMLHTLDLAKINHDGLYDDPDGVGNISGGYDNYIQGMLEYFIRNYRELDFDAIPVFYDAYLHMRRNKPRPLRLSLLHGELNSANLIFENGKLNAIIDWELARVGDPREDLGWFRFIDAAGGTNFFNSIDHPGGFLGYYNQLTGFDVSPEELNYFQVFGYSAISMHPVSAIKRRVQGLHNKLLHMYLIQVVIGGTAAFTNLLGYEQARG